MALTRKQQYKHHVITVHKTQLALDSLWFNTVKRYDLTCITLPSLLNCVPYLLDTSNLEFSLAILLIHHFNSQT